MKTGIIRMLGAVLLSVVVICTLFLSIEFAFRAYLKISGKHVPPLMKYDEVLDKTWFVPHPYLIYTFKPSNKFTMNKFGRGAFTTNAFGFRSTLEFDVRRKYKSSDTLRIATIGGSTTMGVNSDDKVWPYLVGKNLSKKITTRKIEVLNEGLMGYTSLENLTDIAIRVVDFNPDIYILYLGINDYLAIAPEEVFKTDYSHFRKTLWENLSFSALELMPDVLLKSKALARLLYSIGLNSRNNLLDNTRTSIFRNRFKLKPNEEFVASENIRMTTLRNTKSMIGIIHALNPDAVILVSSFYHFDNPYMIVRLNASLKRLSSRPGVFFTDASALMPRDRSLVYDYGHFTQDGDELMAKIFSKAILAILPAELLGPKKTLKQLKNTGGGSIYEPAR